MGVNLRPSKPAADTRIGTASTVVTEDIDSVARMIHQQLIRNQWHLPEEMGSG